MGFNGSFSGGGGGAGTPGPQGPTGPEGPEGPPGPAGSSTGLDFMSVNATETFTLAAWQDAGAVGGATTVQRLLLDTDRGVACRPNVLANGSAATGARAQGLLLNVASGDFCHGLRVYLQVPGKPFAATFGDSAEFGVVFVDGIDASTASWYGVIADYAASSNWPQTPTLYRMQSTSGANRWTSYDAYTSLLTPWPSAVQMDVWLIRSGTTLSAYAAQAGDPPQFVHSWTVGTGAGMVGARFQMYAAFVENAYRLGILAHSGAASATPPWGA